MYNFLKHLELAFLLSCCSQNCYGNSSKFCFDFDHPKVIELPQEINQISGITSISDNIVFAIDDDHGDLFKIPLDNPKNFERWEFSKDHDHEDLVMADGIIYILRSNGQITYFPFAIPIKGVKKEEVQLKGKREFESLYQDPNTGRIIMLCKSCPNDDKNEVSAYAFNKDVHKFENTTAYTLRTEEIERHLGKKISKFKPSATNIDPATGELYILSAINKLLVIIDQQMQVKQVVELKSKLFQHPEGLCFSPSGRLMISNEATKKRRANILIFHAAQK